MAYDNLPASAWNPNVFTGVGTNAGLGGIAGLLQLGASGPAAGAGVGGGAGAAAGGLGGLTAGAGIAGASAGLVSSILGPLLQALNAREAASLSRSITRGLRHEVRPVLGELVGLPAVPGKGGYEEIPVLPAIETAQHLLRTPKVYSDKEIQSMQMAQRLLNPRFRALAGPATGASLASALPAPQDVWKTTVFPKLQAQAANALLRRQAASKAAQFRNARYMTAAQGFVK